MYKFIFLIFIFIFLIKFHNLFLVIEFQNLFLIVFLGLLLIEQDFIIVGSGPINFEAKLFSKRKRRHRLKNKINSC